MSFSTDDPTRTQWQPPVDPAPTGPEPGPRSTRRRRTLFWPGFALGFLLLASVSCGSTAAVLGFTRLNLAEFQGDAQAWQPPLFVPTPTPQVSDESAGEELIATTFTIGDPVRNVTNSRVNVRRSPGYLSKPGDDVLGQLQPGDALEIVGEPAAADNLIWWRIRYRSSEGQMIEGWVAEATASGVQILSR